MKFRVLGKKFRKKKLTKIRRAIGKIEIGAIGKRGDFAMIPFSEIPDGGSLIEGEFVYTMEDKPISAGYTNAGA